ncbi:MAG TPA: hypothetical protein VFQ23_08530 [Anaerolineales bacterium]|nr:hypothetical protein [Anaerolineales bacterium]
MTVTRNQKIYFAAVGLLALWVGIWGYFVPERVDKAIPWLVPPLHARFIGAIYFSAVVLMGMSMLAKHPAEVRVPTFIVALWTGMLFIISLFYLSEFDFSRGPVWFWFGAYILYPIIGFWLTWQYRNTESDPTALRLPKWITNYFLTQGILITLLALALLLAPDAMLAVWPWKITRMLAQIYSGPFLAYGLGSLMLSRQQTWREVRIVTMAFVLLSIGVIIASVLHWALFSASNPSTWIWFAGLSLATLFSGIIIFRNSSAGD